MLMGDYLFKAQTFINSKKKHNEELRLSSLNIIRLKYLVIRVLYSTFY